MNMKGVHMPLEQDLSIPGTWTPAQATKPQPGRWSSLPLLLVTLLTLGSGLLNLYSVTGPGLPERVAALRDVFPLEFIRLSRSATLLSGFALTISSLNIWKRKRRAWWLVMALSVGSVIFHLTKGIDYEEATLSAALAMVLLFTHRHFTVRSRSVNWRDAVERISLALALALAYGIGGFWLLDAREFGINFRWYQAVENTVRLLTMAPDPLLVPQTRYAVWFLESLYIIGGAAVVYAGFAAFRPVLYRFQIHPQNAAHARQIVELHARSSQDYFKAALDKSFFFSPSGRSFLAYRVGANFAVILGDPVGEETEIEPLVREFASYCRDNGWGFGFHQVQTHFLEIYERLGLRRLKVGDDAIVDLTHFTLEGAAKTLRIAVHKIEKQGIRTRLVEPPVPDDVLDQAREVSDEWLQIPGRRERGFALGQFDRDYLRSTRLFIAEDASGRMLAFVNLLPACRKDEATADLMRRRNDAPNGVMDFLFVKLLLLSRDEGFQRFHLGMAPMSGFQEIEEPSPEERAIHAFFQHLNFLFSFQGLKAFKSKFATSWEPRYEIYRSPLDLPHLALSLSRVSALPDEEE
jgi:phosphatidylglycerol lysyltransferase